MQKWIWISVGAVCAAVGAAFLLAEPLVRDRLGTEAAERKLDVEVGRIEVGPRRIELHEVQVRPQGLAGVRAEFDRVDVVLSWLSPEAVEVHGGRVEIDGTVAEVRERLRKWNDSRGAADNQHGSGAVPGRRDSVRDIKVVWRNAFGAGQSQVVTGFQMERASGSERLGADLVELVDGRVRVQVAGAELEWKREDSGRKLNRVGAAEMRITVSDAPVEEPTKGAAPAAAVDKQAAADEQPGLSRLLVPRPERVQRLRSALALMREKVMPRLPKSAEVDQLWLSYQSGKERLMIGPSVLSAKTSERGLSLSLTPRADARGTPLSLALSVPAETEPVELSLGGGPVSFETLGVKNGDFGLSGVAATTLAGQAKLRLSQDSSQVAAEGTLSVENLALKSAQLASQPVLFPRVSVEGQADLAVDGTRYQVKTFELGLEELRLQGDLLLERQEHAVGVSAHLQAPLVSCAALIDSAPEGLLGPVGAMTMSGTFSLETGVEAKSNALDEMKVRWDFNNGCRVVSVPETLDPRQFREPFQLRVVGPGGLLMDVEFGPGTPHWTPLSEIAPEMEKALLVTEDGRFFRHDGFDDRAIESAIRANTRAGAFQRGASTISMQLAKNLYLTRDKTLARKLREVAFTLLLEQHFDKRELMELYLNVIEFGPGIYGIGRASEHYFDVPPRELTAAQAFFLASILPAPSRSYFETDGSLIEGRAKYVRHLLAIAQDRDYLTETQLERAQTEELRFGQSSTEPAGALDDDLLGGNLADQPLRLQRDGFLPNPPRPSGDAFPADGAEPQRDRDTEQAP